MTSNSEDTATTGTYAIVAKVKCVSLLTLMVESGYGGTSTGGGTSDADGSRREQGYGPGSNVGA